MNQIFIKFEGSNVVYPWPEDNRGNPPMYIEKEDFELRDPKPVIICEYVFNPDTQRFILK